MRKNFLVLILLLVLLNTFVGNAFAKKESIMYISYINGEYTLDPSGLNKFTATAFVADGDYTGVPGARIKIRLTLIYDEEPETRIVWATTDADGFATIEALTTADGFYLVVQNVIKKDYVYLPENSVTICSIAAYP